MNAVVLFILIIVLICVSMTNAFVRSTAQPSTPHYRHDYKYLKESQSFIKINNKLKSWFDAKSVCEAEGSKLAVIRTKEEAEAINKFMSNNVYAWIGVQDLISEGEFETIDGEPENMVYINWWDGEPNDAGNDEDCVTFVSTGKMNDAKCTNKARFICKKEASKVTFNAECDNYDPDYKPGLPDQCIKYHKEPKTWDEAYMICNAEQSHLAIINSKEEAEFYKKELEKYPEETLTGSFDKKIIHVGFHDKFTEGQYVTVDGKKLSESGFEEWDHGYFFGMIQPDNLNNEDCGSMFRSGFLNDVGCQTKGMFICEKNLDDTSDVSLNARIKDQ